MTTAFTELSKGTKLSGIHISSGKAPRVNDMVELIDVDDDWLQVRLYGYIQPITQVWLDVRKKDGTVTQIPKMCRNLDPKTGMPDRRGCPYLEHLSEFTHKGEPGGKLTQ